MKICGFIKGETFWYLIEDGGSKDIGNHNIFLFLWGGRNLKKDGLIFPSDSESLKTSIVLMTFWDTWTLKILWNIHAPDDMRSEKNLNNSPRKQHWGIILPEDNNNKVNNIFVSALIINASIY